MGSICAVLGEAGDPELAVRLDRMLARSPYRGEAECWTGDGVAIGVQSLGWDASLAVGERLVVAFHGWIGNWRELASQHGLSWPEGSDDAGTVAGAYDAVGDRLFLALRGEFAIVILDRRRRELVAVRDALGIRPLFSESSRDRVFIATEVRQVLAGSGSAQRLNEEAIAELLVTVDSVSPETFYKGVMKVKPGSVHVRRIDDPSRGAVARAYWSPPPRSRGRIRFEDAAAELRLLLERAVRRSLPERPFGVSLSGGMDSSSIWALIRARARSGDPVAEGATAYSLLYPGFACDESGPIRAILGATGGEARLLDVSTVRVADCYDRLVAAIDSPLGPTMYQLELLGAEVARDGRTVLLVGEGGDQWLRGWFRYVAEDVLRGRVLRLAHDFGALPVPAGRSRARHVARFALDPIVASLGIRRGRPFRWEWLRPERWTPELEDRVRRRGVPRGVKLTDGRADLHWMLSTTRTGVQASNIEQGGAAAGVEVRMPLMDLDVVEFAFKTPPRLMTGGRRPKHLFRAAMAGALPAEVLEKKKGGSFNEVVARDWEQVVRDHQNRTWELVRRGIVDAKCLDSLMDIEHIGVDDRANCISALYMCELFARGFGDVNHWRSSGSCLSQDATIAEDPH